MNFINAGGGDPLCSLHREEVLYGGLGSLQRIYERFPIEKEAGRHQPHRRDSTDEGPSSILWDIIWLASSESLRRIFALPWGMYWKCWAKFAILVTGWPIICPGPIGGALEGTPTISSYSSGDKHTPYQTSGDKTPPLTIQWRRTSQLRQKHSPNKSS